MFDIVQPLIIEKGKVSFSYRFLILMFCLITASCEYRNEKDVKREDMVLPTKSKIEGNARLNSSDDTIFFNTDYIKTNWDIVSSFDFTNDRLASIKKLPDSIYHNLFKLISIRRTKNLRSLECSNYILGERFYELVPHQYLEIENNLLFSIAYTEENNMIHNYCLFVLDSNTGKLLDNLHDFSTGYSFQSYGISHKKISRIVVNEDEPADDVYIRDSISLIYSIDEQGYIRKEIIADTSFYFDNPNEFRFLKDDY